MWYQYVKVLARSYNVSGCYVCSVMPHSAKQTPLYAKPMNKTSAKCFASFAGSGYQHSSIVIDDTKPYPGLRNGTCDALFWVKFGHAKVSPVGHKVFINQSLTHPVCYKQTNGTHFMGNTTNCGQIWRQGEGAPNDVANPSNGTYVVQGGWWLCGNNAYMSLPANWTGQCAPIHVTDHTFIVTVQLMTPHRMGRRSIPEMKPHDSVWGSDVPGDFKLWTTGSKVALALFPQIGVGKALLRIETLDYRMGLFLNASKIINEAQNKELGNLRTMVLQNRMALDLLTASQGGVRK